MKVKFSIDAIKAKKQFLPLFSTINNSTVLPILESVLIQKDKDLSFTCTDLENTLKIWEPCSGAESFSICLHGRKLKNVINNSIDPAIVVTGDEKKVTIKNGEFSITSTLDSKDNYPKSPVIDKKDEISFTIDTKEILPQVQNALLFVSTDDLRPAMT
ncbi:MAG TPA: hypothetical protein VK622_09715, partial [Puia sp.]|nr:hypothetical protein [Puia sp.]